MSVDSSQTAAVPEGYAVLIRTLNSAQALPASVASLKAQSQAPTEWVFVDSGSTDATATLVPAGSKWHRYSAKEFNFSKALNEGLGLVREPFVLIISSHTRLVNPDAVAYGLARLQEDNSLGGAYYSDDTPGPLRHEVIDRQSFDGFNGLWNTCALVRMSLLRERSFREEVFSAEDQEWSGWLINQRGGRIARISGGERHCDNQHMGKPSKLLNEYVSIAYFTRRQLMSWSNIARQIRLATGPARMRRMGRRFYLTLAWRLAACHFRPPAYQSKYF
jgi:glycosyltransferase involved in cell wall biosynthesis